MAEKTRGRKVLLLIAALAIMYGTFIVFIECDLIWQHNSQFLSLGICIFAYLLSFYCVYRSRSVFACGLAAVYSVILFAIGIFGRFIAWFFPWANALYYCDFGCGDSFYFFIVAVITCVCWLIMLIMRNYKLGVWKEPGEDAGMAILRQQIEEIGRKRFHKIITVAVICLVGVVGCMLFLFCPIHVDYEYLSESSYIDDESDITDGLVLTYRTLGECKEQRDMGYMDAEAYSKIAETVDFDKYFVAVTYNYEIEKIVYNKYKEKFVSSYDGSMDGYNPAGKLVFKKSQPTHKAHFYMVDKSHIKDFAIVYVDYQNGKFRQFCEYVFHDVTF